MQARNDAVFVYTGVKNICIVLREHAGLRLSQSDGDRDTGDVRRQQPLIDGVARRSTKKKDNGITATDSATASNNFREMPLLPRPSWRRLEKRNEMSRVFLTAALLQPPLSRFPSCSSPFPPTLLCLPFFEAVGDQPPSAPFCSEGGLRTSRYPEIAGRAWLSPYGLRSEKPVSELRSKLGITRDGENRRGEADVLRLSCVFRLCKVSLVPQGRKKREGERLEPRGIPGEGSWRHYYTFRVLRQRDRWRIISSVYSRSSSIVPLSAPEREGRACRGGGGNFGSAVRRSIASSISYTAGA